MVTCDNIQHSVVGGMLCFQMVQTAAKKINIQLVVSPHHFQERPGVAVNLMVWEISDMQPTFCGSHVAHLRPQLYWSQNRHNAANQHLSGHTSPDICGYF